jgi:hypothetical protein
MHIGRADEVAMANKAAAAARPISAFGFVFVPANRTSARCASFGAGEARNVGSFAFMREVINVTAVFPLRHAAIVVTTGVSVAHTMRVTNEERPDLLLDTKIDHTSCGFVA